MGLIESLEYILIHIRDCNASNEIIAILKNEKVRKWMEIFCPETRFEKQLKKDILSRKYKRGVIHTVEHYISLRICNLRKKIFRYV